MNLFSADSFIDGADGNKTYLIIGIVAVFIFVVLGLMLGSYLFKFTHREFKAQIINKKLLTIWFSVWGCDIVFIIVLWLYAAGIIPGHDKGVMIFLLVMGIAIPVIAGIYLYFFYRYLAMGIDDKEISFLGERIIIKKISKIETIDRLNQVVVRYIEGHKSSRRARFSKSSLTGQFLIANVSLLDQELVSKEQPQAVPALEQQPAAQSPSSVADDSK